MEERSTMEELSHFHQAVSDKRLDELDMNEVKTTFFGVNNLDALGTQNLQSCSVIAIISKSAAVMTHVQPCPDRNDPSGMSGDENMMEKLEEVKAEIEAYPDEFKKNERRAVIVFAKNHRGICLPDQKAIVENFLQDELEFNLADGSKFQSLTYNVPNNRMMTGYGTVLIDSAAPNLDFGFPRTYVEDQVVLFDGWRNDKHNKRPILRENGIDSRCEPNGAFGLVYWDGWEWKNFDSYAGRHSVSWQTANTVYIQSFTQPQDNDVVDQPAV